jgi:hypothetical protein
MRVAAGLTVLALALAACSTPTYPTTASAPATADAPAATTPAPTPAPKRSPIPRPQVSVRDQCGAAELQGLVGRPRTEIPVPLDPNRQRVACTSCPVTEDFDPGRLNFFFDAETGRIKQVRCG